MHGVSTGPQARWGRAIDRRASDARAVYNRRPIAMARGPKKHLKRLNAPKHWMLDKLGGVFAPKPSPGACARPSKGPCEGFRDRVGDDVEGVRGCRGARARARARGMKG